MTTTVAHIRSGEEGVCIDRSTPLGNPYTVAEHGRAEAIWRYAMLTSQRVRPTAMPTEYEKYRKMIAALHGKTLLCWCSPKPCHGNVLQIIVDGIAQGNTWDEAAEAAIAWASSLKRGEK